jgi:HlyD family secretion protein
MSRSRIVICLVVLAAGTAWYVYPAKGIPVDVAVAHTGEIRTYVEERAKTRLPEIFRVTMPLDGRIQPIRLKEGDAVAQGQEVATLDPVDLDTDLTEAVSQVEQFGQILVSMDKAIEAAKAQVKASGAKLEFSQDEFNRKNKLTASSSITESEINEARLLKIESLIDLEKDSLVVSAIGAVRAALILGRQDAEEKRKRRQRDRSRATLYSPVDGVVLSRRISNERVLPAGEVLLEIGRPQELEVEAEILTQDAVQLEVGAPVDIEGAAVGETPIRGQVSRIYPQGFLKVSSLGVEQQRVLVIIRFDPESFASFRDAGGSLGADYRLRAKIYTATKPSVLIIPRTALFRGSTGGWQVFVVRARQASLVDVNIGLMNDFEAEVLTGLTLDEQVVLAPESSLRDGQRVEPRGVP